MDEEDEGVEEPLPSVRMGALDLPLCALNFLTGTLHLAAAVMGDVTLLVAKHANYKRDMREFKEIVKRYDDPRGIRPRFSEPEDGHRTSAEDQGTS